MIQPAGSDQAAVATGSRAVDDPNYVMIDLEFDTGEQAEALLRTMQGIWGRPDHKLTRNQQARIIDVVEGIEF